MTQKEKRLTCGKAVTTVNDSERKRLTSGVVVTTVNDSERKTDQW